MLPCIVLLPFLVAALVPALDRAFRAHLGHILTLLPICVLGLLAAVTRTDPVSFAIPWAIDLDLWVAFRADPLSLAFAYLIATVAVVVLPYAGTYMGRDPRFFATLLAFMGAMLGVVLADDLVLLFVFWELTSVTSFLLIGHKRESEEARRAAKQAFLVTFTGGLGLLVAAAGVGLITGTTRISDATSLVASPWFGLIAGGLLVASAAKSAQFPFHFWLPNAMAAPTPVSAFLHSATMVQGGVYLLARTTPWFEKLSWWSPALLGLGVTTAVFGGVFSLFQRDLKRLLAYSTVGALGLLIAAIGAHAWSAFFAFFLAHGLYKASMFLVAGTIEKSAGTRDARTLRGVGKVARPLQAVAMLAAASMAALPFTFGFVGKEELLHGHSLPLEIATVVYGACSTAVAWIVGVRGFLGEAREGNRAPYPVLWRAAAWPALLGMLLIPAIGPMGRFLTFEPWKISFPGLPSLIGWGGGVVLALAWPRLVRLDARRLPSFDRAYDGIVSKGAQFALRFTGVVQHGYLNGYARTVFVTFVAFVGYGIAKVLPTAWPTRLQTPTPFDLALAIAMVSGALAAVMMRSRLAAVAALGIVGYGVAMVYVAFGAPDLAMTQFAVETLTLILLVFTFYRLPKQEHRRNPGPRVLDGLVAGAVGLTMTALTMIASGIPNDGVLARFYSERAYPDGKGHNVVNVILVDFRGFDTLGEITVLSIAALGVYALLRMPKRGGDASNP